MSVKLSEVVAVVLAGGFGTRIQHLLPGVPKPMAPVNGRPFLEWVVRYLAKQGVRSVVLSTGHLGEVVAAHFASQPVPGVSVRCVVETTPLGTAGGFVHAVRQIGAAPPAWLLLNGDTMAFAELSRAAAALDDPAVAGAICAREVPDTSRYGSLVIDAADNLVRFEEKLPGRGVISTGVYLFRDALVKAFPDRAPLSIEREVFPALTAQGTLLKVLRMNAPFLDIGTPESLPQAGAFVQQHLAEFELNPL